MQRMTIDVHLTVNIDEEDGMYCAEVAELPGCFAWGRSIDEIEDAIPEAMASYVPIEDAVITFHDVEPDDAGRTGGGLRGGAASPCTVIDHPVLAGLGKGLRPVSLPGAVPDGVLGQLLSLADRRPSRR